MTLCQKVGSVRLRLNRRVLIVSGCGKTYIFRVGRGITFYSEGI